MLKRTFERRVTTPASTTQAAPQVTAWPMPRGTLIEVTVVIPTGHAGLTGVALRYAGEHVYPFEDDSWIEGDDEVIDTPLDFEVGGADVSILTYNTDDTYSHDFIVRVLHEDPELVESAVVTPIFVAPSDLVIPVDSGVLADLGPTSGDFTVTEEELV